MNNELNNTMKIYSNIITEQKKKNCIQVGM